MLVNMIKQGMPAMTLALYNHVHTAAKHTASAPTASAAVDQGQQTASRYNANLIIVSVLPGDDDDDDAEKTESAAAQTSNTATKKSKKGSAQLRRPIICICNDVNTPALRPLRQVRRASFACIMMITFQVAYEISFKSLDTGLLVTRLTEIARQKHVSTGIGKEKC